MPSRKGGFRSTVLSVALFQMRKRLLLIGYNFYPELTGIGKYNGEMVYWLTKNGYDCTVITTYPYYPHWKVQEPYYRSRFRFKKENQDFVSGGRLTVYRCPIYVPAQPSGLSRMMLDFSFLVTAGLRLFSLLARKKFDFVFTVAPSFLVGLLGILYKKARKTPLLYHIQDLQIEAAHDLQIIKSEKVTNALFRLEKFIFSHSDMITSVSEEMKQKIQQKAQKDTFLFPNWTDIKLFYPLENKASLKAEFGFQDTDRVILYSGAIGEKQGLEVILYAAKAFQEQKDLKFLICGSGPYKQKLQQLAESLQLANVIFFPLQPLEKFNRFLNLADVHLIIQKANISDLVIPSKLTTVLAVGGLVIITANPGSGLHALVQLHHMGILVAAENQQALNEGISRAINQNNSQLTRNARLFAEGHLCIDKIMTAFENQVKRVLDQ
jgi:colanic acid biosynthesis glycosyl transferase WcaI